MCKVSKPETQFKEVTKTKATGKYRKPDTPKYVVRDTYCIECRRAYHKEYNRHYYLNNKKFS